MKLKHLQYIVLTVLLSLGVFVSKATAEDASTDKSLPIEVVSRQVWALLRFSLNQRRLLKL